MVVCREPFSLVLGRDAQKMAASSSPSDLSLTNIEVLRARVSVCVCAESWQAGDVSHSHHQSKGQIRNDIKAQKKIPQEGIVLQKDTSGHTFIFLLYWCRRRCCRFWLDTPQLCSYSNRTRRKCPLCFKDHLCAKYLRGKSTITNRNEDYSLDILL